MKKTCLQYGKKNHPVKSYSTLKIKNKCFSARRPCCVLSSEKVFCTIYGIKIRLSPPIFEPVQRWHCKLESELNILLHHALICF